MHVPSNFPLGSVNISHSLDHLLDTIFIYPRFRWYEVQTEPVHAFLAAQMSQCAGLQRLGKEERGGQQTLPLSWTRGGENPAPSDPFRGISPPSPLLPLGPPRSNNL
jgi:hypothetical protein